MAQRESRSRVHYIHRLSYSTRERMVGVFLLLALAITVGLVVIKSKNTHLFEDRVNYHAYLNNAQGISTETNIMISGIEVGRVDKININDDHRIHVEFFVYQGYQTLVRTDSTGALSKLSLIGQPVITIKAGSPQKTILEDGSVVPIEEPMTTDELMAQMTPVIAKIKNAVEDLASVIAAIDPDKIKSSTDDLAATMANIREVTAQISGGEGGLGRIVFDTQLDQNIKQAFTSLENSMKSVEQRIQELKPIIQNTTSVTDDLKNTTRGITQEVQTGLYTVNDELKQLPILINRMQLLMESTDQTLQGLQRVWPLSSAVKEEPKKTLIDGAP